MRLIKSINWQKLTSKLIKNKYLLLFFVLLFWVYWFNTFHTNFSDEFDNIVSGWYIIHGRLPYVGFFSHHNPGAYYISSLITLFTRQSFVHFRMVWGVILFLISYFTYAFFRKKFPRHNLHFILGYLFLLGMGSTYFWGQMMLSETVVGYLLIPAFGLVLLKQLFNQEITLSDLTFLSITTFIAQFTSLTYVFSVTLLIIYAVYLYVRTRKNLKSLLTLGVIFISPYLLFLGYLLVTGSLSEFYFQSIQYNRDYYIYNFPQVAGQVSKHPLRYAMSIFYNTSDQFRALLLQVRDFNFSYPVNITLILANVMLLLYLITRKKFSLSLIVYIFLVYLNARGEPLNSKETDFHSTIYIMASIFNLCFVWQILFYEINQIRTENIKWLYKCCLILMSVYGFFFTMSMVKNFTEKAYTKFMGQAPLIYDEPVAAPIINRIVSRNEYFWIGPFEFQELLYINGKMPSKYHWFLPSHERSEKIKAEITSDLLKNTPKLIVFKDYWQTFGVKSEQFNYPIMNILKQRYFRLSDLTAPIDMKYEVIPKGLHNFDVWTDFYFDKDRQDEIVQTLIDQKIIKLESK